MTKTIKEQVAQCIEEVRPQLQADGGDVELVSIDGSTVNVKLTGACHGCPMAQMTLKNGIEKAIKSEVGWVEKVEAV